MSDESVDRNNDDVTGDVWNIGENDGELDNEPKILLTLNLGVVLRDRVRSNEVTMAINHD